MLGPIFVHMGTVLAAVWFINSYFIVGLLKRLGLVKERSIDYTRSDVKGKVVIVTGANTGIGKRTAAGYAKLGARVIIAVRNVSKGEKAKADLDAELSSVVKSGDPQFPHAAAGSLEVMQVDLSDLESVSRFVRDIMTQLPRVDVVVCNAGLALVDGHTKQGYEICMGTNYLGHYMMTSRLMPFMEKTSDSPRVVALSSVTHMFAQINWETALYGKYNIFQKLTRNYYCDSKLAMILFAYQVNKRSKRINAVAVNPGAVYSDIWRFAGDGFLKRRILDPIMLKLFLTVDQGSVTSIAAGVEQVSSASTYLSPYLIPPKCTYPCDTVGPFMGWQEADPILPDDLDGNSDFLWDLSERLVGPYDTASTPTTSTTTTATFSSPSSLSTSSSTTSSTGGSGATTPVTTAYGTAGRVKEEGEREREGVVDIPEEGADVSLEEQDGHLWGGHRAVDDGVRNRRPLGDAVEKEKGRKGQDGARLYATTTGRESGNRVGGA